jgi:hypothetical protein
MKKSRVYVCIILLQMAVLPVWASVEISQMRMVATAHAELTISTTPGDRYVLQCNTNLAEEEWVDYGEIFEATDSSTVKTVDIAASSCFFRVVQASSVSIPGVSGGPPGAPPETPVLPVDPADPSLSDPPLPPVSPPSL